MTAKAFFMVGLCPGVILPLGPGGGNLIALMLLQTGLRLLKPGLVC